MFKPADTTEQALGRVIRAQFPGTCILSNRTFKVGDPIRASLVVPEGGTVANKLRGYVSVTALDAITALGGGRAWSFADAYRVTDNADALRAAIGAAPVGATFRLVESTGRLCEWARQPDGRWRNTLNGSRGGFPKTGEAMAADALRSTFFAPGTLQVPAIAIRTLAAIEADIKATDAAYKAIHPAYTGREMTDADKAEWARLDARLYELHAERLDA